MTPTPRVSVLACVYNGAPFIGRAVQSILNQSVTDFELVVVNDGSTDRSAEVLASYRDPRVRVIHNETNIGLTRSLNIGLRATRGSLVARQDADDWSHPERLARQLATFERYPEVELIGTQARYVDMRGRHFDAVEWRKCTSPLAIEWQLMFENPVVHTSAMFRRNVILDQFGGYNETFRTNQDFELWSRVLRVHPARNVDAQLVELHSRADSISTDYDIDAFRRIREVFLANRRHSLKRDLDRADDLDLLLAALTPRLFSPVRDLRPFVTGLRSVLREFVQLHPEATADKEIHSHCATLLSRVSCGAAPYAPRGLWQAIAMTRTLDRGLFRRALLRVAARFVAGPVLRQRSGRGGNRIFSASNGPADEGTSTP